MKALFCFADSSLLELNTSFYRAFIPCKMMKEAGYECELTHAVSLFTPMQSGDAYGLKEWNDRILNPIGLSALYGKDAYDAMRWADVVVIERFVIKETYTTIRWLRSLGKKVFCSFDDAYHIMPLNRAVMEGNSLIGPQGNWRGGKDARSGMGSLLYEFREGLRMCDGALVPSRLLQEAYTPYQKNIQLVPNYLYPPMWENLPQKRQDAIVIGYGGTSLHNISLKESGVIPALSKLCRENPRVLVHLQPAFPDVLQAFRKAGVRVEISDIQPFADWPKTVSTFSIGLAPLSGRYDSHRSSLKTQEYAMAGVPWVATDDVPYTDSVGGIKVRNKSEDWYRALKELISNLTLYNNLSSAGKEWATSFNRKCADRYSEVFNAS